MGLEGVLNKKSGRVHVSMMHYENMSVQYEAISKSGKNDIFRCKNVTFFSFFFAQNIDFGYTLEPPR